MQYDKLSSTQFDNLQEIAISRGISVLMPITEPTVLSRRPLSSWSRVHRYANKLSRPILRKMCFHCTSLFYTNRIMTIFVVISCANFIVWECLSSTLFFGTTCLFHWNELGNIANLICPNGWTYAVRLHWYIILDRPTPYCEPVLH